MKRMAGVPYTIIVIIQGLVILAIPLRKVLVEFFTGKRHSTILTKILFYKKTQSDEKR